MPLAARVRTGREDFAALHGKDEEHPLLLGNARGQLLGGRQVGIDGGGELGRLLVGAERLADDPDLLEDARVVDRFRAP